MLKKVGFQIESGGGKGSHSKWKHPQYNGSITLAGKTEMMPNPIKRKTLNWRLKVSKTMNLKYQMIIQWSEEDNAFLVSLPEFPDQQWYTHGDTYEEAAAKGHEVLEFLIDSAIANNEPLPEPIVTTADAA